MLPDNILFILARQGIKIQPPLMRTTIVEKYCHCGFKVVNSEKILCSACESVLEMRILK